MQSGVRGLRHSGLFCIYRLGGARWLRWPWGEILYLCILYLLYMHSVIFIFVLLQILIFVFYIIPFLTFKAAGRGPKVAARGGKCLLRSRNVAGIEILQGFSSMKWGKMFFIQMWHNFEKETVFYRQACEVGDNINNTTWFNNAI